MDEDENTSYQWMVAFDTCESCGASAGWCKCGNASYGEDEDEE